MADPTIEELRDLTERALALADELNELLIAALLANALDHLPTKPS